MKPAREQAVIQALRRPRYEVIPRAGGSLIRSPRWLETQSVNQLRQSHNPNREGGRVYCLVELRGFEPLTSCMPCHPHQFTRPSAASLTTTSVLLSRDAKRGAVERREAACGIVADNLLTARNEVP